MYLISSFIRTNFLVSGSVSMWSPNVNEPLVKMLCHGAAVRSVAVDPTGK